MFAFQTADN
jgi:hypothetical protein